MFGKVGFRSVKHFAGKIPSGFKTSVQKEINRLIFSSLLELPFYEGDCESADALLAEILNQPEVQNLFQDQLAQISIQSKQEGFRRSLENRLQEYAVGRVAISELTGNIIALASGAGMLSKITPGGMSFGAGLATVIAQ